ncbi:MAG: hypothetical protein M3124_04515 [Actinomycetota bacterium]|nr:hypothetical protein [Actinomycetota bacterium]
MKRPTDVCGKAPATSRPVFGREKVTRLFLRGRPPAYTSLHHVEVNGQPGAMLLDSDGHPVVVISVDIVDDLVQAVRAVSNPDKLRYLDPGEPRRLSD